MATKTNTTINGKDYFRIRRKVDGKMVSFYGTSKGDAEKKYKQFLEDAARRKYEKQQEYDNATFGQRAAEYVDNVLVHSQRFATATIYQYESVYKKYVRDCSLTGIIMGNIRPSDVQQFYNGLDVSQQTINRINRFMFNFCKWAQLNDYCTDFLSAVEIPRKRDNKRHESIVIWDDDEIRAILDALDALVSQKTPHRQTFFVYLLLYTGMRIGEAVALKYADIEDGIINVRHQYHAGEIKPPKYNSVRQIPMHDELKKMFDWHKAWHEEDMRKYHYETEYIFTASTGKLYDPKNIRRALKRFYESNGIPYKHPHAYRATFCTQLCRCGVPLEVASSLMGHKSMEVTAKHYAIVRQETKQDAIEKLTYFPVVK